MMNPVNQTERAHDRDLEAIPFPSCIVRTDATIVAANATGRALLQHDGIALDRSLHPDDARALATACRSAREPFDLDCRVRQDGDGYRWFHLRATPIASGDDARWLCCLVDIDRRTTREMRLREELRIREDMLNASVDCIKVIAPDGRLTHMNRAGCEALGVPTDSAFGMAWLELLPQVVQPPGGIALSQALRGEHARFDGSSQLPGEAPRYWDNVLTPLENATGDVTAILCVSRDVTSQREAELRLRLAIRATDDAIWDWDVLHDRMCWNEAIERCHGYAPDAVGTDSAWWFERIHPDDRARVRMTLDAARAARDCKYTMEYRFRRADGRYADIRDRGYLSRDPHGETIRIVGTMLDQTDRKAIERNLKELNRTLEARANERTEELERLWKTSTDVLLVVGFDGIVRRASPAVRDVLGYDADDFVGHHIREYAMTEDAGLIDTTLLARHDETHREVEIRHLHRDGSARWIAWAAASSGTEIHATGRDMTAARRVRESLRRAEEALAQAQKMEAIGRLTGNVAHDFNNLLHVIQSSAELLRRPEIDARRQARCVESISNAAARGAALTRQLLAFGRRSSLTPVHFDVGANIRALGDMLRTLVGPGVHIDLSEEAPCEVYADSNQFDTAIVNIVINAGDAMNREGPLRIHVRPVDAMPRRDLAQPTQGRFVAISIADRGAGIPADKIEAIFEPFFTTKPAGHGTGLGLSQVYGFVRQSGGDIAVESVPGEGSTFTIYLPRVHVHSA